MSPDGVSECPDTRPGSETAEPYAVDGPKSTRLVDASPVVHDTVADVTPGDAETALITGAVLSTVMLCAPLEPVLPPLFVCVAVTEYTPAADNAVTGVNDHAPALHAAVPLWVLAPAIATDTDAPSPDATPHAPPTDVTVAFVDNGNDRATPLTFVTVTIGAGALIVTDLDPLEPAFPAASDCVAVAAYAPPAENAGARVYAQLPALHGAVPFCVPAPASATETDATSPTAAPHVPPTLCTGALVVYGNVRGAPLTLVRVTAGAVLSTVMLCAPLEPVLPPLFVCVAVTEYTPAADNAVTGVNDHAPALHAAVPLWVLAPAIATDTDAPSPDATPHAPPTDVTVAFVDNGNDRATPLTFVSETTGTLAVLWK